MKKSGKSSIKTIQLKKEDITLLLFVNENIRLEI